MILKTKMIAMAICLSLVLTLTTWSAEETDPVAGTLSFMIGDVSVSSDGKTWREADFDMAIVGGDYVRTGKEALCEVTLTDRTIVRMAGSSMQQFEKVAAEPTSNTKSIFLAAGRVWVNAR
ncbi:MAG: hypothetical protein V3S89_13560, partial [Desulfobacterales bacterium]